MMEISADFSSEEHPATEHDFLSGLSDEHVSFVSENGWQNTAGILDSFRLLQNDMSRSVMLPEEGASPEERTSFYKDISNSWTPDKGYKFQLPETLPEDFPYDQAFAEEAGNWFQEAGLHPDAAQKLHDKWVGKMAQQHSSQQEIIQDQTVKQVQAAEAAHRELVTEYGEPESDAYQNVVAKADRALTNLKASGLDITGWFADKGALTRADAQGLQKVADPLAVKLLAFIHDSSFAEDGFAGEASGNDSVNPFEKGSLNLKEQSDLLERNPGRARQMILAAGRDPGLFRL